jgi:hypothetical protein
MGSSQQQRVDSQQKGGRTIEERQVAHDAEDRLLLGALRFCAADELCRAAELGPCPRRHHFSHRFASSNEGARVRFGPYTRFDGE